MSPKPMLAMLALLAAPLLATPASAADIRIACYSDGNECPVTREMSARFMQQNPEIHVIIDEMPYRAILESLPVQVASGHAPDIGRITDFGPMMKYFLDLRPYLKDAAYWEQNFGLELPWMRANAEDTGIYGLPTNLTVTGAIINRSLFEQSDVPLPGPTATWDDWVAAAKKVAAATKTPFAMAWDRSGHRFAGAAIAYGAKYFAADGTPAVVDDGFKAMASRFYDWSRSGAVDNDVWLGAAGGYRDAFDDFQNAKIVLYLSGSWSVQRLAKQVGDAFKWEVVGSPCGTAGCNGGMPGSTIMVAFKQTKSPEAVARYLDWFASAPVYAEWMVRTANIPAHLGLQKTGLTYDLSPAGNAALAAFVEAAPKMSPAAYQLQGYPFTRAIYTPTVDRLSQAIGGQITLDQAYDRITADVAQAVATSRH